MAKSVAKLFKAKKASSGGQMLFVRDRQIGSIYFDAPSKTYTFAANDWTDGFPTFEAAEVFAWMNRSLWLA